MGKIVKLDRALVQISGPDAQKLLHDTLTCNLSTPLENQARWFALLAPQGKILVEGLISAFENGFLLDFPTAELENFAKRMRLYKMRADVTISPREDLSVGWSEATLEQAVQDTRPGMGFRIFASDASDWTDDQALFEDARIAHSIMQMGDDFESNSLFPHDIGMDQLGGVDFKKGCYIGQEVVSRMQHRGTARKRPVYVAGEMLQADDTIFSEGRSIGTVTSASNTKGIGLVRLDKVAAPDQCTINEKLVQLAVPSWASYAF